MSLPALAKTYHAHGNVPFPDTSTATANLRSWWWLLKAMLTNEAGIGGTQSGTRPIGSIWTHVASCDSVTVSTGVDLWGTTFTPAALVGNNSGSAHSWWRGTNGTYDIVLDWNSTGTTGRIGVGPAGSFSAGTTTTGPVSATDFYYGGGSNSAVTNYTVFGDHSGSLGTARYANLVTNTSDLSFTFITSRNGVGYFTSFTALQFTSNPQPGDTKNLFLIGDAAIGARGVPGVGPLITTSGCTGRCPSDVGVITFGGLGLDIYTGVAWPGGLTTDPISGDYWADPIEVWTTRSNTYGAKRGVLADWYWLGGGTVGDSYPSTGAQERVVVGCLLVPFPTVVPTI